MHSERGPLFESFKRQPQPRDAIRSLLYITLGNVRYSCIEYILARTEVALYLSIQVCSIAFIIATIFFFVYTRHRMKPIIKMHAAAPAQ